MPARIFSVDYYYSTVENRPGQGCKFLKMLAAGDVNLLAFNAFPVSVDRTQLVIYPQNATWLGELARRHGLTLHGPHHAFLVQGDDELGALVDIHERLCVADINVSSSTGLTDGHGRYRYIMHVAPEDYEQALEVLGVDQGLQRWVDFQLKQHRRFKAQA
ncbi:hypothetical protein GF314_04075 [bacterium]|nr:hypothetical protein [bacterium]